MLNLFANWFCSTRIAWGIADLGKGTFCTRLYCLCIARQAVGVHVRWGHLAGRVDIKDALMTHAGLGEVHRHA